MTQARLVTREEIKDMTGGKITVRWIARHEKEPPFKTARVRARTGAALYRLDPVLLWLRDINAV